jgi:hypothetical protein
MPKNPIATKLSPGFPVELDGVGEPHAVLDGAKYRKSGSATLNGVEGYVWTTAEGTRQKA